MKRKIFFQVSIILYVVILLFLAFVAAGMYVVFEFFFSKINNANTDDWIGMLAGLFTVMFMGYTFIRFARNKIILDKNEIFVPDHWGNKDNKIQYETHVPYLEIKNIFMIITTNNSLNKPAKWIFTPMPYIVFDCKDKKQRAINVFYFSKKQIIKIIDESITRAQELGNNLEIKTGNEIFSDLLKLVKNRENKK
ncbi:MAG: hypothetical protein WCR30_04380 [Clostridia bacterium]